MDDIAAHLGISKKTLYREFRNKDKLVTTLLEVKLKDEVCNSEKILQVAANSIEWFMLLMQQTENLINAINPVLFYELRKYHFQAWKTYLDFRERVIRQSVVEMIKRGKSEGLVRPDVDAEIMGQYRVVQVDMLFDNHSFPSDKFKIARVQLVLLEHFLYGICTLKGYKLINKYKQIIEAE